MFQEKIVYYIFGTWVTNVILLKFSLKNSFLLRLEILNVEVLLMK